MIKSLIIFIIFVFYSNFSKAEPMWEIAENWVSKKTYSLMGRVDGEYDPWREQMYQDNPFDLTYKDIYLNKHEPYVIFYDFKKEVTIGSDGQTTPIVNKDYYDGGTKGGGWNHRNVIVTNSNKYHHVYVIHEDRYTGNFWLSTTDEPDSNRMNKGIIEIESWLCNPAQTEIKLPKYLKYLE